MGLGISIVVRKRHTLCCVCKCSIPVSKRRPNTTALCITPEKSYVSFFCHRCCLVSWIYTYPCYSLEILQRIVDLITPETLTRLLGNPMDDVRRFFIKYNDKYNIILYDMVAGRIGCQRCGNSKVKDRWRCKGCTYAIYCSKACLNKDKVKHAKLLCDTTFFVETEIYH